MKRRNKDSRYPSDWKDIALRIKNAAGWRCQCCQRQCPKPEKRNSKFSRSEWGKSVLTVHHANFTPEDNRPENLIALCAPCHLAAHRHGKCSNIPPGQLSLL